MGNKEVDAAAATPPSRQQLALPLSVSGSMDGELTFFIHIQLPRLQIKIPDHEKRELPGPNALLLNPLQDVILLGFRYISTAPQEASRTMLKGQ